MMILAHDVVNDVAILASDNFYYTRIGIWSCEQHYSLGAALDQFNRLQREALKVEEEDQDGF